MPRYSKLETAMAKRLGCPKCEMRVELGFAAKRTCTDIVRLEHLVDEWGPKNVQDVVETRVYGDHALAAQHKTIWVRRAFLRLNEPTNKQVIAWCAAQGVEVKPTIISRVRTSEWRKAAGHVLGLFHEIGGLRMAMAMSRVRLFRLEDDAMEEYRKRDMERNADSMRRRMADLKDQGMEYDQIIDRLRDEGFFPGLPRPYQPRLDTDDAGSARKKGTRLPLADVSSDREHVIFQAPSD
jgi:hypothetical protein